MQPILALDAGNSRIKAALFSTPEYRVATQPATGGRHTPAPQGTAAALPEISHRAVIDIPGRAKEPAAGAPAAGTPDVSPGEAAVRNLLELLALPEGKRTGIRTFAASVNPPGMEALLAGWPSDDLPPPRLLQWSDLPLPTALPEPGKTGIDRLLGAVAASVVRQPGQAAVIIDAGTATTVDAVSAEGVFLGGAILPGLAMSARALHRETARLPELDFSQFDLATLPAIGRNTAGALASGLLHGHAGAVRGLVAGMTAEAETVCPDPEPLVLLTGGSARLLAPAVPEYLLLPDLCLQGLAIAATLLPAADS